MEVKNSDNTVIPAGMVFQIVKSPLRYSPAIHVNEEGYLSGDVVSGTPYQKLAMVGYYFGSLNFASGTYGEMDISYLKSHPSAFTLVDATTGLPVNYTFTSAQISQRSDMDPGSYRPTDNASLQYQNVIQVDFTSFTQPGEYILRIDGLGASFPFRIDDSLAMKLARTYALGLYHKRCGSGSGGKQVNDYPFTRFVHGDCHTAKAAIPIPDSSQAFSAAWSIIAGYGNVQSGTETQLEVDQHAPHLTTEASELFMFGVSGNPNVQQVAGVYQLNVSGGHHDAGDYSKYTINSATLIHNLVFAADNFPGVSNLDNFGIPESGNGKCDLYDEAKREADFLTNMQDNGTADRNGKAVVPGGFYTLVYPTNEQYDGSGTVLPQYGDPQIVWPKTTSVTAAAAAALAEIGSSPNFCYEFGLNRTDWVNNPYLAAAKRGWNFLMAAFDNLPAYTWATAGTTGKDNCFQRLYQYGDEFSHNDELAWAAAAMIAAGYTDPYTDGSGHRVHDPAYLLIQNDDGQGWFPSPDQINSEVPYSYCNNPNVNPPDTDCSDNQDMGPPWTAEFAWWGMYEGYGCAVRDYAFAVRSGRLASGSLDSTYLTKCESAISAWGDQIVQWSKDNAYGVSLADQYKDNWNPGFFFPSYWSYDIAVADSLWKPGDPNYNLTEHTNNIAAILENVNYECGRNPNNVAFVTGLGWKRQRAIVDQYTYNAGRILPPTGISLGAIQWQFVGVGSGGNPDPYNFNGIYYPPIQTTSPNNVNSFSLYDRWADAYSPETESVCHQIARGLAVNAFLAAASSSEASQSWSAANITAAAGNITFPNGNPTLSTPGVAQLSSSTVDLSDARIVWEAAGAEPHFGPTTTIGRSTVGETLLEAEATKPDGRRIFGRQYLEFNDPANGGSEDTLDSPTVALYHFDDNSQPQNYFKDYSANSYKLSPTGLTTLHGNNSWMKSPSGYAAEFGVVRRYSWNIVHLGKQTTC